MYSYGIGDLLVDCKTSGCGTYVHSFLATLLTHLGIVGFMSFLTYVGYALWTSRKELFKSSGLLGSNVRMLYSCSVLAIIFFIAIIGVHFTWAVFWFSCGLLLPSISLRHQRCCQGRELV